MAAVYTPTIIQTTKLSVYCGAKPAGLDIDLDIQRNKITAIIGPSGCGKSTLLRCFNRMNHLFPSSYIAGRILFEGQDLYRPDVDPTEICYRVGMVFQRPALLGRSWLAGFGTASGGTW